MHVSKINTVCALDLNGQEPGFKANAVTRHISRAMNTSQEPSPKLVDTSVII